MNSLTCFKAYDIRGEIYTEIDEEIAYRIGRAYGVFLQPKLVVVGSDVRQTSNALKLAVARGLMDAGADVIDIGTTGTEEVYFATFHLGIDGGIEITASHNPINFNGMKLVRHGSQPISGDSGLFEIKRLAELNDFGAVQTKGQLFHKSLLNEYLDHLFTYFDPQALKPLRLVVNSGNGAAGHVIDAIEVKFKSLGVPIEFIKVHHEPDPSFPNGIPNPLLQENRAATADAVVLHQADMGIAWDGDFDRCFLFDENGDFIEGYYIVGLLAQSFLAANPGEKIIHDPRLTWNTIDVVKHAGGVPIQSKTGHAFIKERMRAENAIYGGEMSAHHYFRDFSYCDSGMIPWLLVAQLMSRTDKKLSALVSARIAKFPSSGEINSRVQNAENIIAQVMTYYGEEALEIDHTDGLSMEFANWRFNLRISNTENAIRLNVESRGDENLTREKTSVLLKMIRGES